jgi:hypothetical protein
VQHAGPGGKPLDDAVTAARTAVHIGDPHIAILRAVGALGMRVLQPAVDHVAPVEVVV